MDIEREIFFSKDKFLRVRLIRLSDISRKKILILSNVDISIAAKFSQKLAKPYRYIGPPKKWMNLFYINMFQIDKITCNYMQFLLNVLAGFCGQYKLEIQFSSLYEV